MYCLSLAQCIVLGKAGAGGERRGEGGEEGGKVGRKGKKWGGWKGGWRRISIESLSKDTFLQGFQEKIVRRTIL